MTHLLTALRSKLSWLVGGGFSVMLLAGLPGMWERVVYDRGGAAGPDAAPWSLWVTGYLFLSGISAGAFPIAALPSVFGYRRFRPLVGTALLVAASALVGAMLFLLAERGRPEGVAALLFHGDPATVAFWILFSYGLYAALLVAMSYLAFRPRWGEAAASGGKLLPRLLALGYRGTPGQAKRNDLALRVVGAVGIMVSLTLASSVGMLFVRLGGSSLTHAGLFPVTFIVSALLAGAATVLATSTLFGRGGAAFKATLLLLARLIGLLLSVEVVVMPVEAIITLTGGIPSHLALLETVTTGPFAWVFWVLQLGVGTLMALWLLTGPKTPSLATASVAALYVLVGVFALRLNFVIPQLVGAASVYVPSLMEWNVSIFCFGASGLVFLLGSRLLPVFPASSPLEFELAAHEPEAAPFPTRVSTGDELTEVSHV